MSNFMKLLASGSMPAVKTTQAGKAVVTSHAGKNGEPTVNHGLLQVDPQGKPVKVYDVTDIKTADVAASVQMAADNWNRAAKASQEATTRTALSNAHFSTFATAAMLVLKGESQRGKLGLPFASACHEEFKDFAKEFKAAAPSAQSGGSQEKLFRAMWSPVMRITQTGIPLAIEDESLIKQLCVTQTLPNGDVKLVRLFDDHGVMRAEVRARQFFAARFVPFMTTDRQSTHDDKNRNRAQTLAKYVQAVRALKGETGTVHRNALKTLTEWVASTCVVEDDLRRHDSESIADWFNRCLKRHLGDDSANKDDGKSQATLADDGKSVLYDKGTGLVAANENSDDIVASAFADAMVTYRTVSGTLSDEDKVKLADALVLIQSMMTQPVIEKAA